VNDTANWKQKYRDSLRETEAEESRWRQIEQALRRLVGRLCAAGMGVDPQLDEELATLAAANRRSAPVEELERLAGSLTATIVAVDAVSPVLRAFSAAALPPTAALAIPDTIPGASTTLSGTRWDSTCGAVGVVLQCLKAESQTDAVEQLLAELPNAAADAQLADIVSRTADLIRERRDTFAQERLKSAQVLSEVTERLGEMAIYLNEAGRATRASFEDTARFNDGVISQVRELSAEARGATELAALQSLVSTRLETVTRQISDFRTQEAARQREQAGRNERMHARIADLEREAQDLYRKLDHEKHGARLDPLTRVANRKSFDERFTREIESRTNHPSAMLLWDIDDFKVINDSYGHRAGDRVLQTVANCFVSGLRAEDFIARIGGEEFVVLLSGLEPPFALRIANELRTAVEALRFHFRGAPVRVTVSCGITELRLGDAPGAAFDRADAALYRAKREGKNQCIAA
jgi:diguanylate cyclase